MMLRAQAELHQAAPAGTSKMRQRRRDDALPAAWASKAQDVQGCWESWEQGMPRSGSAEPASVSLERSVPAQPLDSG